MIYGALRPWNPLVATFTHFCRFLDLSPKQKPGTLMVLQQKSQSSSNYLGRGGSYVQTCPGNIVKSRHHYVVTCIGKQKNHRHVLETGHTLLDILPKKVSVYLYMLLPLNLVSTT